MNATKQQIELFRPTMERPSPWSSPRVLHSIEPDGLGGDVATTTVFLTGAECPFRCTMCDLWQYTSLVNTPPGAIPFQLKQALPTPASEQREWIKLYNASNFFDDRSVPKQDLEAIAIQCDRFERVIVENHPRFCDDRMRRFADTISGQLEVAMGLETIYPNAMLAMNKGMTLDDFDRAVEQCHRMAIDIRVFVLLHPPGIEWEESIEWTTKTVDYALQRGVRHVSIIPVRAGNGWIERLIDLGQYQLPTIALVRQLFDAFQSGRWPIPHGSVIEFDMWDWDQIAGGCLCCRGFLKDQLGQFNCTQSYLPLPENLSECECTV